MVFWVSYFLNQRPISFFPRMRLLRKWWLTERILWIISIKVYSVGTSRETITCQKELFLVKFGVVKIVTRLERDSSFFMSDCENVKGYFKDISRNYTAIKLWARYLIIESIFPWALPSYVIYVTLKEKEVCFLCWLLPLLYRKISFSFSPISWHFGYFPQYRCSI